MCRSITYIYICGCVAARDTQPCSWAESRDQYGIDSTAAERKTWDDGCKVNSEKGNITKTLNESCLHCAARMHL